MTIQDRETIRKAIDNLPDDRLPELGVFIRYLQHKDTHPGSAWFRTLYDVFAPVRDVANDMTEDEINQLIEEELDAVRREQDTSQSRI